MNVNTEHTNATVRITDHTLLRIFIFVTSVSYAGGNPPPMHDPS
jgi:hypothetical protein